jgi:KaiC/GvpD/RAD55 family RecA-like ATPase
VSDSYDVSGLLPGGVLDELPAGTNLAIVGPSMSGKRALALQLFATGYERGEGILCITTDSAETIYTELERHVDSLDPARIGIIDTSGSDGRSVVDATTEHVSSPSDLTGISVGTAKLFRQFERRGVSDIRYGLISVSTLLQYMDSKKVFKFLYVYTKRIAETDGLGIYTLDDDSHDPQVVNTITGQFDGVIQLRETDTDGLEFRVRGFGRRPTEWNAF